MEPTHLVEGAGRPERWFDHMFVSCRLEVVACEYRHDLRRDHGGPSDHSGLWAEVVPVA
jgi:endonuclease/exonuclease/phosphatase family metal-dependent hydrolase